ncbi:hypothetical protein D7Y40_13755 [Stenotrophomonas maltophilia]|uniref:YCII-related domain-containing protein n=1 Tax=Stenotrophomonas maltophilia (strain K279a) TaxID=522373 RepID=B2FTF0_STRMK|nr:hypothetical protein [Stenotrophomonas maltophilia]CAQ44847.1 conserved hypothetical protein [Stenotrophomonas maltophilia K279a]MBA0540861.1 hypothetical protein [Stenotrophomonas maltophilia]PJL23283.1 hypothetical protein B9Y71_05810 [Stenotrophomonas maltophilia]PJL28674.1 hypothetical protein B9Y80_21660 [Stenotrophomonas maltophilia]
MWRHDVKTVVILTLKTGASGEALARLSAQETEAVWQGFATGCVRAAYGLLEGAGAVLELETATAEEAARYVDSLPYVAQGLLDVRRCALKPFSGFAMLTK